jgi:hypothetical protein
MKSILAIAFSIIFLHCSTAIAETSIIKDFTTEKQKKFSTAGHPKSKGLNMTISYPKSWKALEGERPHIVQKFVSEGGSGLELALIITKQLPLPPGTVISENELKEFFSPTELRGMLPSGATFIGARPTQIEGLPAGILEYSMRQERAGKTIDGRTIAYMFISGTNLVQIQCMVFTGQLSTSTALARRMAEFNQLFFLMANSIVLQDKYW